MKPKSWCSPGQLVSLMLQGWINRHQQAVIAYQREEIEVLREMLGGKRLRFTDQHRRRLALRAQALSRCTLKELSPLVTPDTSCRWFRKYAGSKYDSSEQRRPGRPPKPQHIRDLVVRLAKENTGWGYTKLRDVMFTLGHKIGRTTVRRILADDGIEPAPERRKHMPWATFLKAHWGAIAAMDFFKVEVMPLIGMDRDPIFTAGVRDMLRHAGANPVRLPRRSPNLHAFIERFIRSIKEECLDRVIPLGEPHLRELIREYMAHYHTERPHQGLDGTLIQPANDHAADGRLVRRERLGGLLNYYYREAA